MTKDKTTPITKSKVKKQSPEKIEEKIPEKIIEKPKEKQPIILTPRTNKSAKRGGVFFGGK